MKKPFIVANVRDILDAHVSGEITFSRMVEMFNEVALSFKPSVNIKLEDYHYKCGDGCCDEYGTVTTVNGTELDFRNTDREIILQGVLEHLGYNVKIEYE